MKKILIISDIFIPDYAPRMGYLCKYLLENNYKVHVLVPKALHKKYVQNFSHIDVSSIQISRVENSENEKNAYHTKKRNLREKTWCFFNPEFVSGSGLVEKMIVEADKILAGFKPDIILCSTYPLEVAYYVSKKYNIPWVADMRDIKEQAGNIRPGRGNIRKRLTENIKILRRNFLLRNAYAVTSVSKWHVDFLKSINKNSFLIYNGYDQDIFNNPASTSTSKFKIVYAGTLYQDAKYRDPSMLFEAVEKLHNEKVICQDDFEIAFYMDNASNGQIVQIINNYHIQNYITINNFVPNVEIPKLLSESSILLVLANKGTHGVMTTKIFEYLAIGRPILCVRSDEDCIEDIINDLKAGCAASTTDETYTFIKENYLLWKENGHIESKINKDEVLQYSRMVQSEKLIKILDGIINSTK